MSASTLPLGRAWNSWDAEFPADMVYLPLGARLSFCAYADSARAFTRFPAGEGVRLGPRTVDGRRIEVTLSHAGTTLRLLYTKPEPFTLHGAWEVVEAGEWGLRFWVLLCVHFDPPEGRNSGQEVPEWRLDSGGNRLVAEPGDTVFVVEGEHPPLMATFHDDLEALAREVETKGYLEQGSRVERGRVGVLRYNLEEMPRFAFAATLAHERGLALRRTSGALRRTAAEARADESPSPSQEGRYAGALDAVRDVIAWNTVWDAVNRRPYTAPSRRWVGRKLGGFGVWLNDVLYHALMAGLFDERLCRDNLEAALAGATPQGNLPCLVSGRDAWWDRSQPPIGGYVAWMLYLRTGSRGILELAFEALLRNHDWWWRHRDGNGNGLLEYGTSPVGTGLFRGTKLAAKDESSMDNSPVHDEAVLDEESGTLDCEDVGLNSLLALDGEMLALVAHTLGDEATASRLEHRTKELKERIAKELWDERRMVFANRLWSGRFVNGLAPTSFFPLLAGAASTEQAAALVRRHLKNRKAFWGEWVLPSVARNDPAFADNVYWRGRIWPPLNFLTYYGLRRYGFEDEAAELAAKSCRLFMREWRAHRRSPENFNAVSGEACDQPDTDPFYGWGALMPWMGVAEVIDVNPWQGWEITHAPEADRVGPVLTPWGRAVVDSGGGRLGLALDGRSVLRTNVPGRFRRLLVTTEAVRMLVPPGPAADGSGTRWVELPDRSPEELIAARFGGRPVKPRRAGAGLRLALPATAKHTLLEIFFGLSGGEGG